MSQNTKQYATIEQALEMVREYMKEKGFEPDYEQEGVTVWSNEFIWERKLKIT